MLHDGEYYKGDIQQRTFKFLSDYFWQGVQREKRNESTSAKIKHESLRHSQVTVTEGAGGNPAFETKLSPPSEDPK
jgi:hypothetical protein